MKNFNRNRPGGGRGFERRGFNGRGSSGPAQMHQATCDKCKMSCEVPFRPTNGRPIYCSNCFENNGGSDSRRFESRNPVRSFDKSRDTRQMFDAVCDGCGNSCKVPFRPSSDKPIYCSNCFGEKKGQSQDRSQNNGQFEQLNSKLDKILLMLSNIAAPVATATVTEETTEQPKDIVTKVKKATKKKLPLE